MGAQFEILMVSKLSKMIKEFESSLKMTRVYVIAMIYSRLDTDCDFDKIAAELNSLKYYNGTWMG